MLCFVGCGSELESSPKSGPGQTAIDAKDAGKETPASDIDEDIVPVVDVPVIVPEEQFPVAPPSGPYVYPIVGGGGGVHHRCGNGRREHVEECDDGNDIPFDGCESNCIASIDCDQNDPNFGCIQGTPRYVHPRARFSETIWSWRFRFIRSRRNRNWRHKK